MAMHHNRVTWREGMFLRPQHFQQQRHWDYQLQNRLRSLTSFHYGILQLQKKIRRATNFGEHKTGLRDA